MRDTLPLLDAIPFPALKRGQLETLQINVGYRCNQSCFHCHVNAGPNRTEEMSGEVADTVLAFLERHRTPTLDITGGAPELNAHFRRLVTGARALGVKVMDRCNLTILEQPGQEDLAEFLAAQRASRWWPRCPAIWKTTSTTSAARACSTARCAACAS